MSQRELSSTSKMLGRIHGAICVQTGRKKAPSNATHELLNLTMIMRMATYKRKACYKISLIVIAFISEQRQLISCFCHKKRRAYRALRQWEKLLSFVRGFIRRRGGNTGWFVTIKEMLARAVREIRDVESMKTSRASVLKLSFSLAVHGVGCSKSPKRYSSPQQ